MLVEAGSVPEPLCGHYRLHGYPLLQVDGRTRWLRMTGQVGVIAV